MVVTATPVFTTVVAVVDDVDVRVVTVVTITVAVVNLTNLVHLALTRTAVPVAQITVSAVGSLSHREGGTEVAAALSEANVLQAVEQITGVIAVTQDPLTGTQLRLAGLSAATLNSERHLTKLVRQTDRVLVRGALSDTEVGLIDPLQAHQVTSGLRMQNTLLLAQRPRVTRGGVGVGRSSSLGSTQLLGRVVELALLVLLSLSELVADVREPVVLVPRQVRELTGHSGELAANVIELVVRAQLGSDDTVGDAVELVIRTQLSRGDLSIDTIKLAISTQLRLVALGRSPAELTVGAKLSLVRLPGSAAELVVLAQLSRAGSRSRTRELVISTLLVSRTLSRCTAELIVATLARSSVLRGQGLVVALKVTLGVVQLLGDLAEPSVQATLGADDPVTGCLSIGGGETLCLVQVLVRVKVVVVQCTLAAVDIASQARNIMVTLGGQLCHIPHQG